MAGKRPRREETFAEFVSGLPEDDVRGQPVPVVNLAWSDEFVDADGVLWRKRGGLIESKALRRLVFDDDVRVISDYMGETTEVPPGERESLWEEAQTFANYYGAEFKNERREHLLVVHLDC